MIHDQHQTLFAEPDALERHFTTKQLGCLWSMDESTIRRMFQDEPGVLKINSLAKPDGKPKRSYVTLKIPESVVRRVHRQRTAGPGVQRMYARKSPSRSPARPAA